MQCFFCARGITRMQGHGRDGLDGGWDGRESDRGRTAIQCHHGTVEAGSGQGGNELAHVAASRRGGTGKGRRLGARCAAVVRLG